MYTFNLKVQELAAGAMAWCTSKGGSVEKGDVVKMLSKLGGSGRHKQNAERDLQRGIRRFGYSLGAAIETCRVRMWDPSASVVYETDLEAASLNCASCFLVAYSCLSGIFRVRSPIAACSIYKHMYVSHAIVNISTVMNFPMFRRMNVRTTVKESNHCSHHTMLHARNVTHHR